MANIAVTYTFSASQKADANSLYQNFVDIVNGLKDETKDLSLINVTCLGTAQATFVSFPAATPTVSSAVYAGYAHAYYNAAVSTYSGDAGDDIEISGTGTFVGDSIITIGSSPLKVTAVKKSIVNIHWVFGTGEFDLGPYFYLNGTTEIQRARHETYGNLRKCSTTIFMDVGHYVTFRSASNVPLSASTAYLSISAIQVG